MDLCAFWKARVRKELLSERDGNSNITTPPFVSVLYYVRKELLSERDGKWEKLLGRFFLL